MPEDSYLEAGIVRTVPPSRRKRVFWLGMHKVLMQTELPRLRALGYEVFNPPYLSEIVDQSAIKDWRPDTRSTLPIDIAAKLSSTNFFYQPIEPEVAEILNAYFDVVIVTINPDWLRHILNAYSGPVIFRVYGQPYSLSSHLLDTETIRQISDREHFWFAPHSEHVLDVEDPWLIDRMKIIPYCVAEDVINLKDTWASKATIPELGMLCPRAIDIPYYADNYRYLKHYFPRGNYKIFGAQVVPVYDEQVVGTIERADLLRRFQQLRGFLYHYDEPTVCYLPPIEFMLIGGPVVFKSGSLLSRYFASDANAPGAAADMFGLQRLLALLEQGDKVLADEIIQSQRAVRKLYDPEYVWPIFDQALPAMIDNAPSAEHGNFLLSQTKRSQQRTTSFSNEIVLPFHKFGPLIHKRGHFYHCSEGIARVIRQVVRALTEDGNVVVLTAYKEHVGLIHGFFRRGTDRVDCLKVLPVTGFPTDTAAEWPAVNKMREIAVGLRSRMRAKMTAVLQKPIGSLLQKHNRRLALLLPIYIFVYLSLNFLRRVARSTRMRRLINRHERWYVKWCDDRESVSALLVPHFHLFPETAKTKKKRVVLYLPDYMPHFYRGVPEMGSTPEIARVAKAITDRANIIFTNSRYTQNYLPSTELEIAPEKIVYFPLPDLGRNPQTATLTKKPASDLPAHYVFYPTRERTSKRLADFVGAVGLLNRDLERRGFTERIYGVLTTKLSDDAFAKYPEARSYITVLPELSDPELSYVYKRALCLLFTSEMEGNFPTQINEALHFRLPIVATDIPLIRAELGALADALRLVEVGDIEAMARAVMEVFVDPNEAQSAQEPARMFAETEFTYERFATNVNSLFVGAGSCGSAR